MLMRIAVTAPLAAALLASLAGAGNLNPPSGPVGPTMKSLQQIEPRTPISNATTPGDAESVRRITQPGSYFLTGDILGVAGKSGIIVDTPGVVTIDLNGFAVIGVAGSIVGIDSLASTRLTIRNGEVREWTADGVRTGTLTHGVRLVGLVLRNNGQDGAELGANAS